MRLDKRLVEYTVGMLLMLSVPFFMYASGTWWSYWLGPIVGGVSLGLIFAAAQSSKYPIERIAVAGCVSVGAALWLYTIISEETSNRMEYQSIVPFLIGFAAAVPLVIWPARKLRAGGKRLIARSIAFTLLLAPIPYGPEGTLMPLIVTLVFPPLVFLFLFFGRIALTFLACLGFFSVVAEIRRAL